MAIYDVIFLAVVALVVGVIFFAKSSTAGPVHEDIDMSLKLDPTIYTDADISEAVVVPFVNYLVTRTLNIHRRYSLKELLSNTRYLEFLEDVKGTLEYANLPIEQLYASEPLTRDKSIEAASEQDRMKTLVNFFGIKTGTALSGASIDRLTKLGKSIVRVMMKSLRKRVNEYRLTNKHFV